MADMIIDVDYNITKAEAKQNKLNREFELGKQKAANIRNEIKQTEANIENSKNKQKSFNFELEQSSAKLDAYMHGQLRLTAQQVQAETQRNAQIMTALSKEEMYQQRQTAILATQNLQYNKQVAAVHTIGEAIVATTAKSKANAVSWLKTNKNIKRAQASVTRFGKRIGSLVKSALLFTVLTKALTALRDEFSKFLTQTDTKTAELISKLKGNLKTMGTTIYESSRPYIEWLLEKLVKITQVLTVGIAKILGKSVEEMRKLTKSTEEAGEEARNATAGFDTLQTINTSSSNDNGKGADFSALEKPLEEEILLLTGIVSSALLVLGVILAFTGANIPLGIGLIAIGAIGLAASIAANWDTMTDETNGSIAGVMAIGGALFIILGLILILTGAGIPLGIGLILLGAGLLYSAYAITPGDDFVEKIRNLWGNVKKITQEFLDWWKEKVINKVFGKGMGDALQDLYDSFIYLFEDIVSFFEGVFTGDWEKVWKSLINVVVDILNITISQFNSLIQGFLGGGAKIISAIGNAFGREWNLDVSKIQIPKIPRLATGTVIPGGSPFLAMLGDQRRGQTNIEAPLDTIVEAFKAVQSTPNFTVEATGNMAQLIRLLNLKIKQENVRASVKG